jgi:hypothetical protein
MENKYTFDEKRHCHSLNGKPLIGITSALQIISKPFLIQWSANMACDYVKNNLKDLKDLDKVLQEAKVAHRKKKEKAGSWGTDVHLLISDFIKTGIEPEEKDETKLKAFNNFKKWAEDNKVKFLESEKHLYSKNMWTGGIMDLMFEMDGKKYIGDIKTSSGIYNEAFYQIAGYHLMLKDMGQGEDVEGYIVINLKKDGTMDLKLANNLKINQDIFMYVLNLYKLTNSIE